MIFVLKSPLWAAANNGVDGAIDALSPLLSQFNVTAGDLIQFAGAVAVCRFVVSNCLFAYHVIGVQLPWSSPP